MADGAWLRGVSESDSLTPRHLERTLGLLGYDFGYPEQRGAARRFLTRFKQRWGGISADTLAEVARRFAPPLDMALSEVKAPGYSMALEPETAEEEDTLFVLAALGVIHTTETPFLLLPYLASQRTQECWLAAYGLAALHDERALPTLARMLVEFVGPDQPWSLERGQVYIIKTWYYQLLRLLPDWGDPRIAPLVRAALIATVHAEELEVPEPHGPEQEFVWLGTRCTGEDARQKFHWELKRWIEEELLLIYTLGRLGAFGALMGVPTRSDLDYLRSVLSSNGERNQMAISAPEDQLNDFRGNIWRVHACFGYLESRFRNRLGTVYSFKDAPGLETEIEELVQEIKWLLAGRFGLDEAMQQLVLEEYDGAGYTYTTVNYYRRIAKLAQEGMEEVDDVRN